MLGSMEARLGSLVEALELSEASQGGGAKPVHLGPVEVIALAVIARLSAQMLDRRLG